MSGYFAVLIQTETGSSTTLGPWSHHVARRTVAKARRNDELVAGVVGRRDGHVRES